MAVRFDGDRDADARFGVALRLGAELEAAVGITVDLVDLEAAPLRLVGRILAERLVLVGQDDPERVAFEVRQFKLAVDFEHHAAELDRALLGAMARGGSVMVDPLRLRALLERLRGIEGELDRLRGMGRDPVRQDPDRLNSVKYLFVLAAEVAIDAGQHVVASEGLDAPYDLRGCARRARPERMGSR